MKPKRAPKGNPLTLEQAARALGRTALSRSMTLEEGIARVRAGARRSAGRPDPLRSPQALADFRRRKGVRVVAPRNPTPRDWRTLEQSYRARGDEAGWDLIQYFVPRTGPEARFRTRLVKALRAEGYWVTVTHGGPFQAGLPDIVSCIDGTFVGIELKALKIKAISNLPNPKSRDQYADPNPKPSDLQAHILGQIEAAGGRGLVAICVSAGRVYHYQLFRRLYAPVLANEGFNACTWAYVWDGPDLAGLVDHVRRQVQVEGMRPAGPGRGFKPIRVPSLEDVQPKHPMD